MSTGAQRKEEGMAHVLDNEDEGWKATYLGHARAYMAANPQGFTGEACRVFALSQGLRLPHHSNAWSAVWGGIARSRKIMRTGRYVKSQLASRHANEVPEWAITQDF